VHVTFKQEAVIAPSLIGLAELADQHSGVITIISKVVSIHFPLVPGGDDTFSLEFPIIDKSPITGVKESKQSWLPDKSYGAGHPIVKVDNKPKSLLDKILGVISAKPEES